MKKQGPSRLRPLAGKRDLEEVERDSNVSFGNVFHVAKTAAKCTATTEEMLDGLDDDGYPFFDRKESLQDLLGTAL